MTWRIGWAKEIGRPYLYSDDRVFYLCRPRFWRTDDGWWLAPLIRIGYGEDGSIDSGVMEIPWIEKADGRIRVRLMDRS